MLKYTEGQDSHYWERVLRWTHTIVYLLEGLIYQPHILLKYFFQGGKTHSVAGLWALSLALGQWVMLPTLQISEDTGGRQRGGCKNTQLLLGDILHPLLRRFQRGQRGKQSQNQVTGMPVSLEAWMTLERGSHNGTVQSDFKHFQACFEGCRAVTPWCWKIISVCRGTRLALESEQPARSLVLSKKSHIKNQPCCRRRKSSWQAVWKTEWARAGCQGNNHPVLRGTGRDGYSLHFACVISPNPAIISQGSY